ncbi:cupin domain-containing protein [Anaeromyxobacter oryzae]|uniref:Cupin domain-containing protein n=1 Tax=Anaeromyxobacter oryzae TaxID=2918170 RepID=A0ABM7WZW1_9BACT|nr:hypothetical protein [Anaeromyxobacter oryzae]BDG05070.1 hypothetical protein AMOR_40660 [Anaeromyxobacter oryzae]
MAKTKLVKRKLSERARVASRRTAPTRRRAPRPEPRFVAVKGATRRDAGAVQLEIGRAGAARVKRAIYPPGFRWSVDMKPVVRSDLCMHAHVGFLASGALRIEYPDGCTVEYEAPQIVAIDPGHDGAVLGDAPAVLIEFDFEGDTVNRLGMPGSHRHP